MHINVPTKSSAGALVAIAVMLGIYLWVPTVHEGINAVVRILSVRDLPQAIQQFRDYLLGFGL